MSISVVSCSVSSCALESGRKMENVIKIRNLILSRVGRVEGQTSSGTTFKGVSRSRRKTHRFWHRKLKCVDGSLSNRKVRAAWWVWVEVERQVAREAGAAPYQYQYPRNPLPSTRYTVTVTSVSVSAGQRRGEELAASQGERSGLHRSLYHRIIRITLWKAHLFRILQSLRIYLLGSFTKEYFLNTILCGEVYCICIE